MPWGLETLSSPQAEFTQLLAHTYLQGGRFTKCDNASSMIQVYNWNEKARSQAKQLQKERSTLSIHIKLLEHVQTDREHRSKRETNKPLSIVKSSGENKGKGGKAGNHWHGWYWQEISLSITHPCMTTERAIPLTKRPMPTTSWDPHSLSPSSSLSLSLSLGSVFVGVSVCLVYPCVFGHGRSNQEKGRERKEAKECMEWEE